MKEIDQIIDSITYDNWFTVLAVLADKFADSRMESDEAVCRWLIEKKHRPIYGPNYGTWYLWEKAYNTREKKHIFLQDWLIL